MTDQIKVHYAVILFTYPEGDNFGEFDKLVLVTPHREVAEYEADKQGKMARVEVVPYYG